VLALSIGAVLLAVGMIAGYFLILRKTPVPELWTQLPRGDGAMFSRKGETGWIEYQRYDYGMQQGGSLSFVQQAEEMAAVFRGKSMVCLFRGRFEPAKIDAEVETACRRETVEGRSLWIAVPGGVQRGNRRHSVTFEALYAEPDRVVVGARDLVVETLRKRSGDSFADTLTSEEKSALRAVGQVGTIMVIRSQAQGAGMPFDLSSKELEGAVGVVASMRKDGTRLRMKSAIFFRDEESARKLESTAGGKLKELPDGEVKISRSGRTVYLDMRMPESFR
jgi:hypothetical protein